MAIMIYKIVQATGNAQLGGLNDGFFNVTYQPAICGRVNKEATNPIANVIAKLIINGKGWNFLFKDFGLIYIAINQIYKLKFYIEG